MRFHPVTTAGCSSAGRTAAVDTTVHASVTASVTAAAANLAAAPAIKSAFAATAPPAEPAERHLPQKPECVNGGLQTRHACAHSMFPHLC